MVSWFLQQQTHQTPDPGMSLWKNTMHDTFLPTHSSSPSHINLPINHHHHPTFVRPCRYSHQQLDVEFITQLTEACFTLISRRPVSLAGGQATMCLRSGGDHPKVAAVRLWREHNPSCVIDLPWWDKLRS
jgi:hypothetical protein